MAESINIKRFRKANVEDFDEHVMAVMASAYNRTMFMLRVKRVVIQKQKCTNMVRIFLDGGMILFVTPLHTFPCVRDPKKQALTIDGLQYGKPMFGKNLKENDWIWVDVKSFMNEGMILKKIGTKG